MVGCVVVVVRKDEVALPLGLSLLVTVLAGTLRAAIGCCD